MAISERPGVAPEWPNHQATAPYGPGRKIENVHAAATSSPAGQPPEIVPAENGTPGSHGKGPTGKA
jgi:hypothetical protein